MWPARVAVAALSSHTLSSLPPLWSGWQVCTLYSAHQSANVHTSDESLSASMTRSCRTQNFQIQEKWRLSHAGGTLIRHVPGGLSFAKPPRTSSLQPHAAEVVDIDSFADRSPRQRLGHPCCSSNSDCFYSLTDASCSC